MSACPHCSQRYEGYRVVGLRAADATVRDWLDEHIPVAMLFCRGCGRVTLMHPDHPSVQRLQPEAPVETMGQNIRTLNVDLDEIQDAALRRQFEGEPE